MLDTGYLMPVEPESSIEDPGSLHINVTNAINDTNGNNANNDLNEVIITDNKE
jgi:hypothetical protein